MSCQQAPPRVSEDPYAFTDAPTTNIFNTQRNKLTSLPKTKLIINAHKNNIVENKIVNITNQQAKVIGSPVSKQKDNVAKLKINSITQEQQEPKLNLAKTTRPIIINGKTVFPKSVIVNNNVVNQNSVVTTVEATPTKNVGAIKTTVEIQQRPQQQHLTKFANCNVKLISPSNSTTNVITSRKVLPTVSQTQPQLVTLHQSHPLYSITKQTPILTAPPVSFKSFQPSITTSISNSSLTKTTTILSNQNPPCQQQQSQSISSQNPVLNVASAVQSKPLTFQQQYILQQQQRINGNNNITTFETLQQNQHHSNNAILNTSPNVITQQEQQVNYQISSLPLPQSNFAQPQQIKQLSNGPSPTVINKNTQLTINSISKNIPNLSENSEIKFINENLENMIQTSVIVPNNTSPPPLVLNTHTKTSPISVILGESSLDNNFVSPQHNYNSSSPPGKRNSRILSTGTVSSLKSKTNKNSIKAFRRSVEGTQRLSGNQSNLHQTVIKKVSSEWHAPESYVFDCLGPFAMVSSKFNEDSSKKLNKRIFFEYSTKCDTSADDLKPPHCIQIQSLQIEDFNNSVPSWTHSREKRIELRKSQLRRKATQLRFAQKYWSPKASRRRFQTVLTKLIKFDNERDLSDINSCCLCKGKTVPLTSYCQNHIIHDEVQKLFLPCSAFLGTGEQCKRPVFDLIHLHPLCDQHSLAKNSLIRQIPEFHQIDSNIKSTVMVPGKKRSKTRTISMPIGRPKKQKTKRKEQLTTADSGLGLDLIENNTIKLDNCHTLQQHNQNSVVRNFGVIVSPQKQQQHSSFLSQTTRNNSIGLSSGGYDRDKSIIAKMHECQQNFNNQGTNQKLTMYSKSNVIHQHSSISQRNLITSGTTQDLLTMCENSSAYESSEDTGVGGLSESELIVGANDVIEEIPLEEHDITNVLNELPDAFNDLFTNVPQNVSLEPANHDEKEDLARAIERAVVSSLHQMTSDQLETNFLESFLDGNDEMLVDENDDVISEEICTTEVIFQQQPNDNCNSFGSNALIIDGCSNSIDEMGSGSNSGNSNSSNSNLCTTNKTPSNNLLLTGTDMRNLVQT